MAFILELLQHFLEQRQLSRRLDQLVAVVRAVGQNWSFLQERSAHVRDHHHPRGSSRKHLDMQSHHSSYGEEVGVVAALLQVHHDVEQGHLVATAFGVEGLEVPRQDELVVLPDGARAQNHPLYASGLPIEQTQLTNQDLV